MGICHDRSRYGDLKWSLGYQARRWVDLAVGSADFTFLKKGKRELKIK
jgi:hypothetical protein